MLYLRLFVHLITANHALKAHLEEWVESSDFIEMALN